MRYHAAPWVSYPDRMNASYERVDGTRPIGLTGVAPKAQHGRPAAFYSDKHSIRVARGDSAGRSNGVTQFGRALAELNIDTFAQILRRRKAVLSG